LVLEIWILLKKINTHMSVKFWLWLTCLHYQHLWLLGGIWNSFRWKR